MDTLFEPADTSRDDRKEPAGNKPARLAVVIVTYNSASVLPGLLDSLPIGLDGGEPYEVIVVDNDSHDESVDIASAHPIGARVIETGRNAGYAAGINAATAAIGVDCDLLVLNPDIRLRRNSVQDMYAAFRNPSVGVVVPQILDESGPVSKSIRREPSVMSAWAEALLGGRLASRMGLGEIVDDPDLYRTGGRIEWATGAILLVSAAARQAIGDWDESFFLYSEEVDYLRRARAAGIAVVYTPDAQVVHIGGDYQKSNFLTALMTTNRITYFRRHHSAAASLLFRLGIIAGEVLRLPKSPVHRAALKAAFGAPARL